MCTVSSHPGIANGDFTNPTYPMKQSPKSLLTVICAQHMMIMSGTMQNIVFQLSESFRKLLEDILVSRQRPDAKALLRNMRQSLHTVEEWMFTGMKQRRRCSEIDLLWASLQTSLSVLWLFLNWRCRQARSIGATLGVGY